MYKGFVIANSVFALPILGFSLLQANRDGGVGWIGPVAVFAPVLLLLGIGMMLYFRNTRVDFGDGMISRTNLLGVSKSWPLEAVRTVLDVPNLVAPREVPTHSTFVLDDSERLVVRISNRTWEPLQIKQLVDATGITPITLEGPTTAGSIRDRYPHVISWRESHPYEFATYCTIAFVGVFAIVLIIGVAR